MVGPTEVVILVGMVALPVAVIALVVLVVGKVAAGRRAK